jgi:hypothetical protein
MELALVDEAGASPVQAGVARFTRPVATVREVIRARAELHWEDAGQILGDAHSTERGFGSLFQDVTRRDAVAEAAEKAFLAGRFFLLLDDHQAEDLDEEIDLARTGAATFLMITPLKGG